MDLTAGSQLGPYRLLYPVGKGGVGEVWKAHDPRLNREVAIKVSAEQFSDRFEREARAVAALNHPYICTLYDVGPDYLVMELVEGPTLAERLRHGAIPVEEALAIARQIADALEAAHEKGIVHRDLKPGNIKIKSDGAVKVLDFGLAKAGNPSTANPSDSPTLSAVATEAGVILGTAAYMSPEQARGKAVDKRADIWAFGVVLHEMITGRRLFQGETTSDTLAAVIKELPDLSELPPRLRPVVERCLSKDSRSRWRDIGDVRWALDQEASAVPVEVKTHSYWPWAIAVAASFAVALAVWFLKPLPRFDQPLLQMEINGPPGATLDHFSPRLSPDGRHMVFSAATKDGKQMLWLRSFDSNVSTALPGTENSPVAPFWSPDSRWIAFLANKKLQKLNVAGGPPQVICDAAIPDGTYTLGTWSVNDIILLTQAPKPIQQVSAKGGGTLAPVLDLDSAHGEVAQINPFFLPDGKHFLYASYGSGMDSVQGLRLASLTDKTGRLLIRDSALGSYAPNPAGGGWILYQARGGFLARPFDPDKGDFTGEAVSVIEGAPGPTWSTSNNGFLAFQRVDTTETQLTWRGRDGRPLGVAGDAGNGHNPRISPDQKSIAFTRSAEQGTNLWLLDIASPPSRRFTFEPSGNGAVWSSDSTRILYGVSRQRESILIERPANGIGAETSTKIQALPLPLSISRDDHWLIMMGKDLEHIEFWKHPGGETPVLALEGYSGSISPDGRWLLYAARQASRSEIIVKALPTELGGSEKAVGTFQITTNGGSSPIWSGNGKEVFYLDPLGKMMAVPIESTENVFRSGTPTALFDSRLRVNPYLRDYDVTSDGQRFLISQPVGDPGDTPISVIVNWPKLLERK
jgi:serine/threonine protein kinase